MPMEIHHVDWTKPLIYLRAWVLVGHSISIHSGSQHPDRQSASFRAGEGVSRRGGLNHSNFDVHPYLVRRLIISNLMCNSFSAATSLSQSR